MKQVEQATVRQMYQCKRCGWKWISKLASPTVCPKCHSAYWDKERKIKGE